MQTLSRQEGWIIVVELLWADMSWADPTIAVCMQDFGHVMAVADVFFHFGYIGCMIQCTISSCIKV